MYLIAFAFFFGNGDTEGWHKFWKFAITLHPQLNATEKTIITDQNAGCIAAVTKYLPLATHFYCSWHQKGNILKKCIGGKKKFSGWWLFHNLVNCVNIEQITKFWQCNLSFVGTNAIWYVKLLSC